MNYITKNNISYVCDFGSQMSEYACLYSISKKLGNEVLFFKENINPRFGLPLIEPFIKPAKVVSVNDVTDSKTFKISSNSIKHTETLNPNLNYDSIDLIGMYTEFHDIKDEIVNLFEFKEEIINFCKNYLNDIKKNNEILISVHFRLGDYIQNASLHLKMQYYMEAHQYMSKIYDNIKLLIFSNDIEWCKNNIKGNCIFVENLNRFQDMCLMTLCDHNIIANSTFSWWGAYLNKSIHKEVICPYHYLNDNNWNHIVNGKYYPPEWVALQNQSDFNYRNQSYNNFKP